MPTVHPLSYVAPGAELADDVVVGPFCYVEADTVLGSGTRLDSHCTIKRYTILGRNNKIGQGVVLGGEPQDRKFHDERSYLRIGDDNFIREYVTIHRASGEGLSTTLGDRNYLMAYVHLGHNCTLADDITMANSSDVSGHVTIEEKVVVGGMVGVHQFVRIGKLAMVGGMSRINQDVPPFMVTEGEDQEVHDINAVGLRRIGVNSETRMSLHKACKLLFRSQLSLSNSIELVRREVPSTPEVEYLIEFMNRRFKGKNGRGDQP